MTFIIALSILIFRLAVLLAFGYMLYSSKGWKSKIIVFLLFFFYCISNIAIVAIQVPHNVYKFDIPFISEIELHLREIQYCFAESPFVKNIINLFDNCKLNIHLGLFILCYITLLAPIATLNFLHFICSFIYIAIVASLWAFIHYLKSNNKKSVSNSSP